MKRSKTLSLPLVAALFASTALPAAAQLELELSSYKTFRQNQRGNMVFGGGSFQSRISDGLVASIPFCDSSFYYRASTLRVCAAGTTGFLSSGSINGATIQAPYLLVTALQGAIAIEGGVPELVRLNSAPASALPRPLGGFRDDSAKVFYNLHTTSIREYGITNYLSTRSYNRKQRDKFDSEIVPGVYYYSVPRLNAPHLAAPVSAVIYPMAEGLKKIRKQNRGVVFTDVNQNRWSDGFVELSFHKPNKIRWKGITPSETFAGVDKLYFSMRALRSLKKPKRSSLINREAIFPPFDNNTEESRVMLQNPYVTSFTTPPIFPSGTRAMVELEVQRNFQTGGISLDRSNRKFQIPVIVIDRYAERNFKGNILVDNDGDGFNNLTEWILDSDPNDALSIPVPPEPDYFIANNDDFYSWYYYFYDPTDNYFGFNVDVKRGTIPNVKYILQRSTNGGKTWSRFHRDSDPEKWSVRRVTRTIRGITRTQIQVRSLVLNPVRSATMPFIEPPGTSSHLYRVKIVLNE